MTFESRILVFRFFPRNGYLIVTCDRNVENVGQEKKREITTERLIGFDLRVKMAGMITVSFEGKQVGLSREDLNISELKRIYQLDSPVAHLKIKSGAGFQNIWPDRAGEFGDLVHPKSDRLAKCSSNFTSPIHCFFF